jgi:hypothetical protein
VPGFKLAEPLGSHRVDDNPAPVVLELAAVDGAPVALDGITAAAAELVSPAGVSTPLGAVVDTIADTITVDFGATILNAGGIWSLELTVTGATSTVRVEPAPLVVEAGDGWHTLASARARWADAPKLDAELFELLETAKTQCVEYAPALPAGVLVPIPWRQAQKMQARNIWNAAKTDPASGGIGGEDFIIRPYPMDQTIRYMLRPKRAIGATA